MYIYYGCNSTIDSFANIVMWYIGLDDIWETDMSNTYDDTNVCRYALGHRDVVYSLGKTQNVARNVIAISIGDISEKAASLYTNFDGHAGKEGDYTEYHHIGFEVVANRILEQVIRYADQYDNKYQKVYWITGEGGGGSVANLLAKKLIDKYGSDRVYTYTFNALNTINIMDIPEGKRISNEKYRSIYNLYNDDNQTINLFNNESNFYMYGITKHASIMNNATYRDKWRTATGIDYQVTTKIEYAKEFVNMLYDELNGKIVRGFITTEEIQTIENYLKELRDAGDISEFKKVYQDIMAFYASMNIKVKNSEYDFSNITNEDGEVENYNRFFKIKNDVDMLRDENFIKAFSEISGSPKVIGYLSGNHPIVFSKNKVQYAYYEDDGDVRNGDPFKPYIEPISIKYDNISEATIRISKYKYSNYTIDNTYAERTINYVKFWNEEEIDDKSVNGRLGDYDMGDYGKDTKFTNESDSVKYNNFNNNGGISEVDNGIRVIGGRILAAFPAALKSENEQSYNDSSNSLHLVRHYKLPTKWRNISGTNYQHDGGTYSDEHSNISIGQNEIYKLVDCVFEDSNNQQFVVPFVVIDAKNIHLLPNYSEVDKEYLGNAGMMSNLTDNRYGQVVEMITSHNKDNKGPYAYNVISSIEHIIDSKGKDTGIPKYEYLLTDNELKNEGYDNKVFKNDNKRITYFDKSDGRDVVSMSPIEVLTVPKTMEDKEIRETIFGDDGDYKLISMRIYKDNGTYSGKDMHIRVATNEGLPLGTDEENHPLMWSFRTAEINDNTKNIEGSVEVVNDYYEYPEYLNRHEDKTDLNSPLISNHIVNYE